MVNASKTADILINDGIRLTKIESSNLYGSIRAPINGLGLSLFNIGSYYLVSCFAYSVQDHEQWPALAGAKRTLLSPGKLRRVWTLARATSTARLDYGSSPSVPYGSGAGVDAYFPVLGGYPDGSSQAENHVIVYAGGFQIEEVICDLLPER